MANTTDLMISCLDEEDVVRRLSAQTSIHFIKVSDGEKCGGQKVVIMESFAYCSRCLGEQKVIEVIAAFKRMAFEFPESAVLIVDDDDAPHLDGVYLPWGKEAR